MRRCAAYEQRLLGQMGIDKKTLRFAVGRTGDSKDPHADLIMNESPNAHGEFTLLSVCFLIYFTFG